MFSHESFEVSLENGGELAEQLIFLLHSIYSTNPKILTAKAFQILTRSYNARFVYRFHHSFKTSSLSPFDRALLEIFYIAESEGFAFSQFGFVWGKHRDRLDPKLIRSDTIRFTAQVCIQLGSQPVH